MSLYISNPSKQHVVFNYREPVNNLLASVEIASGCQIEIGHGWTPEQKAAVIAQIERFGGRDAAESHAKMEGFMGLLYRDAGFISEDEIRMGHDAVVATQEQRSVREAVRGALAFDRSNRTEAIKRRGRPARVTAVEVEQEVAPNSRPTGDEVVFGLTVDPEGRSDVKLPV